MYPSSSSYMRQEKQTSDTESTSTTFKKMKEYATLMGLTNGNPTIASAVNDPLKLKNSSTNSDNSVKCGLKRTSNISISPKKMMKKLFNGEPIRTFIFMDLETTGIFPRSSGQQYPIHPMGKPHEFSSALNRLILETQRSEYPKITEMSFISVPREIFIKGQTAMKLKSNSSSYEDSLKVRFPCNVHTRQLNPEMSIKEWNEYEALRRDNATIVHSRDDLLLKNTFAQEWPSVIQFLKQCPKPACLVAHNGLWFDFRVLYGELLRFGFINDTKEGIPDGVMFIDSWLAIREIEENHRREMEQTTELVDWRLISDNFSQNDASASNNSPSGIRESLKSNPEDAQNCEKTPTKVSSEMSKARDSTKLNSRRRFFQISSEDHPLLFLNTDDWSPAKMRRIKGEFFSKRPSGYWNFNKSISEKMSQNSLSKLYYSVIKDEFDAHYAQEDCYALPQICMAYGKDFINYADTKASEFPF